MPFKTVEEHFDDRNDAIIWIIKNQFGRRNLSAYDRSILALKLKPVIAAKAKEQQIRKPAESVPKNSCEQTEQLPQTEKRKENRQRETNYQVAQKAGVSEDTIRKVEKIEQQATPEIKAALKSGDLSINAAYNKVQQTKRKEEIQKQAEAIEQRAIEQPNGLFDVIVIDPPWGYVKQAHHGSYDANGRRGTCPYPEMTQDELKTIELPAAEEEIAAQAKARQAEYHGNQYQSAPEDICPQVQTPQEKNKIDRQNKTNYQLAKMAGVSDKLTCSLPHFTRVKS